MADTITEFLQAQGIDPASANMLAESCVTNGQYNFVVREHAAISGSLNEHYMNSFLALAGLEADPSADLNAKGLEETFNETAILNDKAVSWGEFYGMTLQAADGKTLDARQAIHQSPGVIANAFTNSSVRGETEFCTERLFSEAQKLKQNGIALAPATDEPDGHRVRSAAVKGDDTLPPLG